LNLRIQDQQPQEIHPKRFRQKICKNNQKKLKDDQRWLDRALENLMVFEGAIRLLFTLRNQANLCHGFDRT
jgi:hypothetical protein